MSRAINQLVRQFVTDLGAAAESEVAKRIRAAVLGLLERKRHSRQVPGAWRA
jgi:hypothetical protein